MSLIIYNSPRKMLFSIFLEIIFFSIETPQRFAYKLRQNNKILASVVNFFDSTKFIEWL